MKNVKKEIRLSMRLDCVSVLCLCVCILLLFFFFFFFLFSFFIENNVFTWDVICQWVPCTMHGTTTSLTSKIFTEICLSVGLVHCSRDLQTSFFNQTFIKNGSHGTINTFKNYFVIVFLVFNFQF